MITHRWKFLGWSWTNGLFGWWDYDEEHDTPVDGFRFLGFHFEKRITPARNWEEVDVRALYDADKECKDILYGWYMIYDPATQQFELVQAYANVHDRLVFKTFLYQDDEKATRPNVWFWNDGRDVGRDTKKWAWYGPIDIPNPASFSFYQGQ